MEKFLFFVLFFFLVSVVCQLLKDRIRELLFSFVELVKENITTPFKDWSIFKIKSLRDDYIYDFIKSLPKNVPMVLVFIIGLVFCRANYHLLALGMVFLAPPTLDKAIGFSISSMLAVLWILTEIFIGAVAIELYYPLDLFPKEFIGWIKQTKAVKKAVLYSLLVVIVLGSLLGVARGIASEDIYGKIDLVSIIVVFVNFFVSLIFPVVSLTAISLGFQFFLKFLIVILPVVAVIILMFVTALQYVIPAVLVCLAGLLSGLVFVMAEPTRLILVHVFGVQDTTPKKDNKDSVTFLSILLLLTFISVSCYAGQNQSADPKDICLVFDKSGSFRASISEAIDTAKIGIVNNLSGGDRITVLEISDSSFRENSVICQEELPVPQYWADKDTFEKIKLKKKGILETLDKLKRKMSYHRSDIWRSIFFGNYILKNKKDAKDNRQKIFIIYTDLEDNIQSKNQDLLALQGITVFVLFVSHGKSERDFLRKKEVWEKVFRSSGVLDSDLTILDPVLSRTVKILD